MTFSSIRTLDTSRAQYDQSNCPLVQFALNNPCIARDLNAVMLEEIAREGFIINPSGPQQFHINQKLSFHSIAQCTLGGVDSATLQTSLCHSLSTSRFSHFQRKTPMAALLSLFFAIIFSSTFNVFTATAFEVDDEPSYTYVEGTGKGPKKWGEINPHWRICNNGEMQSPIDLLDKKVQILPKLKELRRDYKLASAMVENQGHVVAVTWKGYAGRININGTDYKLHQCHWHTPAEHTIDGLRHNLELHIVHKSSNGGVAVVGIIYKYGRPDPFLTKLIHYISSISDEHPVGIEEKYLGAVNPWDIKFGSRKYYRYIGSLTTPPCTEGVVWTIIKKVRTVSREQVKALREAVHHGFEANARPIQELGGRTIGLFTPRDH